MITQKMNDDLQYIIWISWCRRWRIWSSIDFRTRNCRFDNLSSSCREEEILWVHVNVNMAVNVSSTIFKRGGNSSSAVSMILTRGAFSSLKCSFPLTSSWTVSIALSIAQPKALFHLIFVALPSDAAKNVGSSSIHDSDDGGGGGRVGVGYWDGWGGTMGGISSEREECSWEECSWHEAENGRMTVAMVQRPVQHAMRSHRGSCRCSGGGRIGLPLHIRWRQRWYCHGVTEIVWDISGVRKQRTLTLTALSVNLKNFT